MKILNGVVSIQNEEMEPLRIGKQINTIQWSPVEKGINEKRSLAEYYSPENPGNVVIASENNGIYVYTLSFCHVSCNDHFYDNQGVG